MSESSKVSLKLISTIELQDIIAKAISERIGVNYECVISNTNYDEGMLHSDIKIELELKSRRSLDQVFSSPTEKERNDD